MVTIAPLIPSFQPLSRAGLRDVALFASGAAGLAASLTVVFLGMRAVLDIGGYRTEGGP